MSAESIFGADAAKVMTTYEVELRMRGVIVGGIPSDPSVIESWLRARMELSDPHLSELLSAIVQARDVPMTADEKVKELASSGAVSVNGFIRDQSTGELMLEGRNIKAALKEWANSAFPGVVWPGREVVTKRGGSSYRKGLKSTLAEWVNVPELAIGLGVKEPTRVEERVKHVSTAQGPRSAINRVEVVDKPTLSFHIRVLDDFLPQDAWARIWELGEQIGLGADRARGDGTFVLERFKRVAEAAA